MVAPSGARTDEGRRADGTAGAAGRSGLATAGTALGLLLAVAAGVVIHANSVPPERAWAAVSFPLVWATPALLALLARRRAVLLVPAAVVSVPLSFTAFSGGTLLLLVPAALYAAAAARRGVVWPGPLRTAVLVALPLGGLAAFGALLAHEDPVCWDELRAPDGGTTYRTQPDASCGELTAGDAGSGTATATTAAVGGGSTSDTIVAREAAASALVVAGTLAIGWFAAAPRRRR